MQLRDLYSESEVTRFMQYEKTILALHDQLAALRAELEAAKAELQARDASKRILETVRLPDGMSVEKAIVYIRDFPALEAANATLQAERDDALGERDAYMKSYAGAVAGRDEATDMLFNVIYQACYNDGKIYSNAMSDYADAMRLLARMGKLTIVVEHSHRNIVARVGAAPDTNRDAGDESGAA